MPLYIADYQTHRNKHHFRQKHDAIKSLLDYFLIPFCTQIPDSRCSLDTMELRVVEEGKIACACKLFNDVSPRDVRFGDISNYGELLNIIQGT